ncbi:integrase [Bifidobacterium italicum]|uniref:Integrase n=1 Tax=Bifidobacterium italicum TaxID=1960968 RepID=A0A2A2EK30_9BIFI|nr:IS3 family transposase [Bifidobacterium italicum]PAU69285.1 integrase [Bifidobacterium italicum]
MVTYTREQKIRAVELYERYDHSPMAVIHELGYPSRTMLARWHAQWMDEQKTGTEAFVDRRVGGRYNLEQKQAAVDHYIEHGRCLRRTLRALGYPSHEVLANWVDELAPGERRLRRAPVDAGTRMKAVVEVTTTDATSAQVAREIGVDASVVRNWKRTMLPETNKERTMNPKNPRPDIDARRRHGTPPDNQQAALEERLAQLRAERDELEIQVETLRFMRDELGKDPGADPVKLPNADKTRLVIHLADTLGLRETSLLDRFEMAGSTFFHNKERLRRPPRDEWLLAPVLDAFEQSHGTYGYRRIWQVLRANGIRVCARRVMRLMAEHGIRPSLRARKCYSSYKGESGNAPANLVARDFHAPRPNMLWVTDITEFHVAGRKVYLSPVIDCFDGLPVAWTIGTSPNAELADTMLEQACATLAEGERPVVHSDRGCHYQWPGWISICDRHGLTRSMSAKGCSPDNAAAEGFFGRLKQEFYYNRDHSGETVDEFMDALDAYMRWYRDKRVKTEFGTSITKHRKELGLMA